MHERLKILRDYFPTAIFTGNKLVFISEDWRVELTEHKREDFARDETAPIVRVRLCNKTSEGEFEPGHYEDFELTDISDLAGEVEKFVQFAVGKNLRE